MKVDARAKRVFYNVGALYLGKLGQGIAILAYIPLARESLSPELFGVWMMLSALLGFMAFADLGIGNGVLNQAALATAKSDRQLLQRTLLAGYAITSAVGFMLIMTWIVWATLSSEPTLIAGDISVDNQREVLKALTIFVIVLAINIPASLIQRVQLGTQQGYLNGLNQLACALLTITLIPLTLKFGGSASELVLATVGVQALVNVINSVIWIRHHGVFHTDDRIRTLDLHTVMSLLKTGAMFFLLQLAAAFAFHSDAIVITQTLGPEVYGDFAVIQKLFLTVSVLFSPVMVSLWPAFREAIVSYQKEWAIRALKRGIIIMAPVAMIVVVALVAGLPWIFRYWMKASVELDWGAH